MASLSIVPIPSGCMQQTRSTLSPSLSSYVALSGSQILNNGHLNTDKYWYASTAITASTAMYHLTIFLAITPTPVDGCRCRQPKCVIDRLKEVKEDIASIHDSQ